MNERNRIITIAKTLQSVRNKSSVISALGYEAENINNKSTDIELGGDNPSDVLYPSQAAVNVALRVIATSILSFDDELNAHILNFPDEVS